MNYEKLYNDLYRRSRLIKLFQHQRTYFINENRRSYLKYFKRKLEAVVQPMLDDEYVRECIDIFAEDRYLQKNFANTLNRIISTQKKMYNRLTADLPFASPDICTGYIYETEPKKIIRMLVVYHCSLSLLGLIFQLEKANKRGEIGAKQERLIFEKAIKGEDVTTEEKKTEVPVIGFVLKGTGRKMKLTYFYKALKEECFLEASTTEDQFVAIFSGEYVREPVRWQGTISQLVYLIGVMVNKGLIDAPKDNDYGSWLYQRLIASFVNKRGSQLRASQLKDAKNAITNKERNVARSTALTDIVIKMANTTWNSTQDET